MDIKKLKEYILSFIFTKRCRFCNKVCDIREEICADCCEDIHTIDGEICFNCGCSKLACDKSEKKHFYESVCAPYYYEGAPKKSVLTLKHSDFSAIVGGLAHDMVQCVHKRYEGLYFDCCAFVPMHKDDEEERGYNQAQLLAEKIAEELNIPCYNLLKKDYKTNNQHALPSIMRTGNLLGAISYNEEESANIDNMRILLCDDIKTTGCTLDECTKTLLFKGCAEVRCVTACIKANTTKEKHL